MDSGFRRNDELVTSSRIPIIPNPESSMDLVFIEDLRIDTVIGIYDWERRTRQTIALDIEMAFDNRKPAASDAIERHARLQGRVASA